MRQDEPQQQEGGPEAGTQLCAGCEEELWTDGQFCYRCSIFQEYLTQREAARQTIRAQPRHDMGVAVHDPDFGSMRVSPITLCGMVLGVGAAICLLGLGAWQTFRWCVEALLKISG